MTTLKDFVTTADSSTVRIFKMVGKMLPMYHVVDGDGDELVFPSPDCDKDTAVRAVRAVLKRVRATRVLYIDEAWVVSSDGDEDKARAMETHQSGGGGLEHYPGRMEVVLYVAEDEDEGALMARREITRDADGTPTLGPLVFYEAFGRHEGRMAGMLPRRKKGRTMQ
jgi:hypothetical protein